MPQPRRNETNAALDFTGRIAWVTGAGRGIGLACARALADRGARVVGLDLEVSDELQTIAPDSVTIDIGDRAGVEKVTAELVANECVPDIVVSNAGITRDGVIWKLDDEDWTRVIDVNLTGSFRLLKGAIPAMRAADRGGSIICIGSINGLRGKFGQTAYASAKAGLHGLVRSTAKEVARFGIRVNAILPGLVDTEMTRALPPEMHAAAVEQMLIGRAIEPTEVADAVLFLASDLSRPITGVLLPVDGGQSLG